MLADFMDRINKMGKEDNAPNGIQIGDVEGNLTILDFLIEAGDDDSNASDESFKHDHTGAALTMGKGALLSMSLK